MIHAGVFEYDDENQLVRVWITNSWKSEFVYDAKMRRKVRKEFAWSSGWVKTNEVRYIYDGNLVIQERGPNNLPSVSYTRGIDLGGGRERAGGIGGLLARTDHFNNQTAFYHADANGNVTALINDSERVVARYLYDAFGNTLSKAGALADVNLYRFSSKETDLASGLVYFLYRYYDANLQRWVNRDPIGEIGGINLYNYVGNNPMNRFDPLGLDYAPILPNINPIGSLGQMFESLGDFWYAYKDMRKANTIGADKYFHCLANCRASKKGPGVPLTVSVGREVVDTIKHINHPIESIKDSMKDMKANKQGWSCPKDESCESRCAQYRPPGLSSQY